MRQSGGIGDQGYWQRDEMRVGFYLSSCIYSYPAHKSEGFALLIRWVVLHTPTPAETDHSGSHRPGTLVLLGTRIRILSKKAS